MKKSSILLAGALASCASIQDVPPDVAIVQNTWALAELQGQAVPTHPRPVATLRFYPNGKISGTWSCNNVGAGELQWTATPGKTGGEINAEGKDPSIITTVGCPDPIADRFWHRMYSARSWYVDGKYLFVVFADGSSAQMVPTRRQGRHP